MNPSLNLGRIGFGAVQPVGSAPPAAGPSTRQAMLFSDAWPVYFHETRTGQGMAMFTYFDEGVGLTVAVVDRQSMVFSHPFPVYINEVTQAGLQSMVMSTYLNEDAP